VTPELRNEMWLAFKICGDNTLGNLFSGITDVIVRRNRMRQAILERKLEGAMVAKGVTFSEAYRRLYGVGI